MELPETRVAALIASHPEIEVHLTLVADLDEDDVAMVDAVLEHLVAKRAPPT
jgi:hypothetical protein